MAVVARQHIKRMRGGANAHLLLADDDRYYVVKFRNNPQHQHILVNELLCCVLLKYLQLPVPAWQVVDVPQGLVEETPELTMEAGRRLLRCESGLHFGSCYPGDPARRAVYDYLPLSLLRLVLNVDTFRGMVAFDKWVSNADGRQVIFFRDRAKNWLRAGRAAPESAISPRSLVYVANMIDHGFAFNAQNWDFSDTAELGLYNRWDVYGDVTGFESFEPWLDRIVSCPTSILDEAYRTTPPQWYDRSWDRLESLLERLYQRRALVPDLVRGAKRAARDPFPNWPTISSARAIGAAGGL